MSGDGTWLPATGSGTTTETNVAHWTYSASGTYSRPFDGGHAARDLAGGRRLGHELQRAIAVHAQPRRLLDHHRHGLQQRQRLGRLVLFRLRRRTRSPPTTATPPAVGDSSFSSQASETYAQGWSSQYTVLSTLAANGSVTTITTASASGSASGGHAYTSSGSSSSWSQTGDYAAGNGSVTQSSASSGLSLTESLQSQWQEGYIITSLPGLATATTGGASGSSQASGDASSFNDSGGTTESDSQRFGLLLRLGTGLDGL